MGVDRAHYVFPIFLQLYYLAFSAHCFKVGFQFPTLFREYTVAVGIIVMHLAKAANLWIYLVANLAAGALAAATFRLVNPEDK